MPTTCWAPGCKSGYRSSTDTERHFFKAPKDPAQLQTWRLKIPRQGELLPRHSICDLHFQEHFILKTYTCVIDGSTVMLPRGRWELTKDAIPTIFHGVPQYLTEKVKNPRKRPAQRILVPCKKHINTEQEEIVVSASPVKASNTQNPIADHNYVSMAGELSGARCADCKRHLMLIMQLRRKLKRQGILIHHMRSKAKERDRHITSLQHRLADYALLPPKINLIVNEAIQNAKQKTKTSYRYSSEWLLDSLLIRCKSTCAYNMLRDNGFLPLPSISTLNRAVHNMRPEFGFDSTLAEALTEKLANFAPNERRGMLMFDEIQISKNLEFRADTGKVVGMVDFGDELTTNSQRHLEGDHALVFLFQSHLGGWVQTIGSFCSSGTTPAAVLAKLVLQCVILLEKCGARVDGLVSDGASTNRSALATMGMSGEISSLQNKMQNPCDSSRDIHFFCDAPHLMKTVRNNLLKAKEFILFSKSVADGLRFYQSHSKELHDVDPTIQFAAKMNDIFDLSYVEDTVLINRNMM